MANHPDDLSDLERRLAALAPAAVGLDADRMLFAAGRASVTPAARGAFWPVAAVLLTLLSSGLAAAWLNERAEHRALAEQWDRAMLQAVPPTAAPAPGPPALPAGEMASPSRPAPDSVLAGRRMLESGLDDLAAAPAGASLHGLPPLVAPVLRARPADGWPGL